MFAATNVDRARTAMPAPGTDWVPLFRDDAKWDEYRDRLRREGLEDELESCVYAWIALGVTTEVTGFAEFRAAWTDFLQPWDSYESDVEELIDLGDRVLLLARLRARGQGLEHEIDTLASAIFHFDGGRISRLEFYAERDEGLQAAGYSAGSS